MPDREKVIKGLEHCIPDPNKSLSERMEENECRHAECPYGGKEYERGMGCFWSLMSDALSLLKEQEKQEARLLTAEEVQNMKAGTAFGIETYYDHDGKRMPGCTWALRTESLILSFFGTMFPDTVKKIPYNTLEKNENTGKQERHQYRFWSKKPTFDQCKAVKWE